MPAMWQKWMMLSSVAAINCLMRGTVGEIVAAPAGVDFAEAMLAETSGDRGSGRLSARRGGPSLTSAP